MQLIAQHIIFVKVFAIDLSVLAVSGRIFEPKSKEITKKHQTE
jgi:hypothetical protein